MSHSSNLVARLRSLVLLAFLVVAAGPGASNGWCASGYSLRILGTLRSDNLGASTAQGINAAGTVVGGATDMSGVTKVFRWSEGAGMSNEGNLVSPYASYGVAINSAGALCGYGLTQSGGFASALYQAPAGSLQNFPETGGGGDSYAFGISDGDVSVGWSNLGIGCGGPPCTGNPGHAITWNTSGGISSLPDLGGYFSAATGVSQDGSRICGYGANPAGQIRAFRLQGNVASELPPLPGFDESRAYGINSAGQVVGYSGAGPTIRATLWNGTSPIDLGLSAAAVGSFGYRINESGLIVGYLELPGPNYRAAIFQEAIAPVDLNTCLNPPSTYTLKFCLGLNSAGQIVGDADSAGVSRGYVLTPQAPSSVPFELPTTRLELREPSPNPSAVGTVLRFSLSQAGPVQLVVMDVTGRLVTLLKDEWLTEGDHVLRWDGRNDRGHRVSGGTYFIRLREGERAAVRKLVVNR